jgi:hypothetical protein
MIAMPLPDPPGLELLPWLSASSSLLGLWALDFEPSLVDDLLAGATGVEVWLQVPTAAGDTAVVAGHAALRVGTSLIDPAESAFASLGVNVSRGSMHASFSSWSSCSRCSRASLTWRLIREFEPSWDDRPLDGCARGILPFSLSVFMAMSRRKGQRRMPRALQEVLKAVRLRPCGIGKRQLLLDAARKLRAGLGQCSPRGSNVCMSQKKQPPSDLGEKSGWGKIWLARHKDQNGLLTMALAAVDRGMWKYCSRDCLVTWTGTAGLFRSDLPRRGLLNTACISEPEPAFASFLDTIWATAARPLSHQRCAWPVVPAGSSSPGPLTELIDDPQPGFRFV